MIPARKNKRRKQGNLNRMGMKRETMRMGIVSSVRKNSGDGPRRNPV
jgi:hypothetical protein